MFRALSAWFRPPPALSDEDRRILLEAVDTVEPFLRTVGRFESKLADATRLALGYCDGLAQQLPGPIEIDIQAYANDPLVHAFFPTKDDIDAMLGKSRGVRAFLNDPAYCASDEIYFMLGMRLHEKQILGHAMQGDIIRNDVPQRILYFGDHTLREFGKDAAETRRNLRAAGFYSLARGFAEQIETLRKEKLNLNQERAMTMGQRSNDKADSLAQKRAELDEQLRDATESLMPERILEAFVAWLKQPELRLRLQPVNFTVDRMGVISDAPSNGGQVNDISFHEVVFPELVGRDRRRWISIVARIQRQEAQAAVALHEQATRYLII
jgi:hypothetical protein